MKKTFFGLVGASVLTVGSVLANVHPIIGSSFISPETDMGFMKASMEFQFVSQDSITSINHCTFTDGQKLDAKIVVPAKITDTEIEVTGSDQNTVVGRMGMSCEISVAPGKMSYSVAGDQLTLILPAELGMPPFLMTRVK
ncbi:hypothetical protein K2X30_05640 [bacterium]|nr:hypothetical protein [bacterium]